MTNVKLTGAKAKLVNEACSIKEEMKEYENRLKVIKEALGFTSPATYVTLQGCTLTIGEMQVFEDIDPKKLAYYLKKKGKAAAFYKCVKVMLTNLKKEVPQSDIDKMRNELPPTTRWTYK